MYPRFGMTYVAIQTAQARLRAAQQHQQGNETPDARAAVFSQTYNDEVGALWRMGAVIAVVVAGVAAILWFAN